MISTIFGEGVGAAPGPRFQAQLFVAPEISLAPIEVGEPVPLYEGENGFWPPTLFEVPGYAPGSMGIFYARVWDTNAGNTYEAASKWLGAVTTSDPLKLTLGGGGLPPAETVGFSGLFVPLFIGVPEPSAVALLSIGAGALWFGNRFWRRER